MQYTTVGAKQAGDNARWQYVWQHIKEIYPREKAVALVERTAYEVQVTTWGCSVGWAWSGGKDSQALRLVMEQVGIRHCVLGMSYGLEYPEFLRWATDHMPPDLDVIANEALTLEWLAAHPEMLFPQNSATAAKWFRLIQHKARAEFYDRYDLNLLIVGRRLADRNHVGDAATGVYTNGEGVTRYSPLRHWTHEDVLAVCAWYDLPLPPCYGWPNGWVVGTGCWPARQWTGSVSNGWAEVHQIDPSIVVQAAQHIESAQTFLEGLN